MNEFKYLSAREILEREGPGTTICMNLGNKKCILGTLWWARDVDSIVYEDYFTRLPKIVEANCANYLPIYRASQEFPLIWVKDETGVKWQHLLDRDGSLFTKLSDIGK